jgi:hypothetical protein
MKRTIRVMTITRITTLLAAAAAIGATTAPTAHAQPGVLTSELYVVPYSQHTSNVVVLGKVRMSRAEAQSMIGSGHKVMLRVWGDDLAYDDLLLAPYEAGLTVTETGLEFSHVRFQLSNDLLDEDWGRDEVYAGARLVNAAGATIRAGETNRVKRYF